MVVAQRIGRAAAAGLLASGLLGGSPDASAAPAVVQDTETQTYIVLYSQATVPADAAARIGDAGGHLVHTYDAIGVAIATSSNASFRDSVRKDTRVEDAGPSARGVVRLKDRIERSGDEAATVNAPATDSDSLSALQWDMRQIHAPEAHRITGGSPSVLVGDLDTGLDYRHPDLKANVDFANSASCLGGKPDQSPAAWNDDEGHGTHTAGIIAAASNGLGIVGVAPNVRLAAIKVGDSAGFFFPEAVVCGFMWAAMHHIQVTNNSYFSDPFYFNCPSDPAQRAILTAEQRAIRFAQDHGVVVVAATGNFSDDLAHPTQDRQSPDNTTPITRPVTRACLVVPTDVPGVIGVGATGSLRQKSFYSNYGLGITQVVAPGGDSRLQDTGDTGGGRVLSTYPPARPCARKITVPTSDSDEPIAAYCYLQGTSMASPHVVGVAALILSQNADLNEPDDANRGRSSRLQMLLNRSTDPIPCPDATLLSQYAPFKSANNDAPQTCQGTREYNSWYGHGEIDALKAVARERND